MIFLINKMVKNITFRDPLWIHKNVKQLVLEQNEMYKKYVNENKYPEYLMKLNVSKMN